jgi:Neurotransmitter-gated ion-channel ligand binding domain
MQDRLSHRARCKILIRSRTIVLRFLTTVAIELIVSALPMRVALAATQNPEQPLIRLLDAPPSTNGRIRVEVALAITNLAEVDEAREQFRLSGFIFASWDDSRLGFNPRPGEQTRFYRQDQIWTPGFQMLNAIAPGAGLAIIRVSPNGRVRYAERFAATLSTKFHLQQFPFDNQNFQIVISPFASRAIRIDLKADKKMTQLVSGRFELEQWTLRSIIALEQTMAVGVFQFEQIEFRLSAHRRPAFYVWTIMLPLIVMLIVAWSVLWIAPANFAQQLGIAMPTFLSVIAFSYAMAFTLPRVPYLTFINAFFLSVYLFVFLSVLETVAIYAIVHSGREQTAAALHGRGAGSFHSPISSLLRRSPWLFSRNGATRR